MGFQGQKRVNLLQEWGFDKNSTDTLCQSSEKAQKSPEIMGNQETVKIS